MVTTVLPATEPTSIWHERCALPSDVDGAGTAETGTTAVFRAGQSDMVTGWPIIAACSGRHRPETFRLFKVNENMLPPLVLAPFPHVHRRDRPAGTGTALLLADADVELVVSLATWRVFHMGKIQKMQPC